MTDPMIDPGYVDDFDLDHASACETAAERLGVAATKALREIATAERWLAELAKLDVEYEGTNGSYIAKHLAAAGLALQAAGHIHLGTAPPQPTP